MSISHVTWQRALPLSRPKDHYAQKAKEQGFASRAAFKLKELQKKYRFMKSGSNILELGAAPGGWTKVISDAVGRNGKVYCVDLLPIKEANPGNCTFVISNFCTDGFLDEMGAQGLTNVDGLLSDAAPDTTGIRFRDAVRSAELCMRALEIAEQLLVTGGYMLVKIYAGDDQEFYNCCRSKFSKVQRLKPDASKKESKEFYVFAQGYKGNDSR